MPEETVTSTAVAGRVEGRERILQAATELFAQRGFHGVSISDVAESAGVVKSAIYHHFDSKETLYSAVLARAVEQSRAEMGAGARGATWRERVEGALQVLAHLIGPQNHILNLILNGVTQMRNQPEPFLREETGVLRRAFVSVLSRELASGMAAGDLRPMDPELAAVCLVGVVASALQGYAELSDAEHVRFAVDLYFKGANAV